MTMHDLCDTCWKEIHPDVSPLRMIRPEECRCRLCGRKTRSGIRTSLPGVDSPSKNPKTLEAKR